MPRISPALVVKAYRQDTLLPLLVGTCRTIKTAMNELRWLRQAAKIRAKPSKASQILRRMCKERSRAKPLQYIISDTPFGALDLLCRPGVLIPRDDTEAYVTFLADQLLLARQQSPTTSPRLRIADICSGSGCIGLLLFHRLHLQFHGLHIQGYDISRRAISLARQNLRHNARAGLLPDPSALQFHRADILDCKTASESIFSCDIVVANPPYISGTGFRETTSRSVRLWEPRGALVPRRQASTVDLDPDIFHEAIHRSALAKHVAIVVMEIADECQALRVARKLLQLSSLTKRHFVFEIWREELSLIGRIERVRINSTKADEDEDEDEGITIDVRGRGRMRVVVCYDARGAQLLGR